MKTAIIVVLALITSAPAAHAFSWSVYGHPGATLCDRKNPSRAGVVPKKPATPSPDRLKRF